jgi:hypothetical protein
MALFTDGPISSIEDLTGQDSQLLNVASVEGIDVTQKIALAQEEIGLELGTLLARSRYTEPAWWFAPPVDLSRVVVTAALKLWHTNHTLEMVYSDAYNSQLNDRYAGRRDQFHKMARQAYETLRAMGVGMASQPVPRASTPNLAPAQGALPDGTYYVTMGWINSAGEEGAAALPATITTASCTLLVQPGTPPQGATGWNVYAGAAPDAMTRQNVAPIAIGQMWMQPGGLALTGQTPGCGQAPNYFQPMPRIIQRG